MTIRNIAAGHAGSALQNPRDSFCFFFTSFFLPPLFLTLFFLTLIFTVFSGSAHAYISVPHTDGDGSFLVTWTDEADTHCNGQAIGGTAYQIKQGSSTFNFGINDPKYTIITGKSQGSYTYSLKVRRCNSSAPGGYTLSSAGSDTVTVQPQTPSLTFNLSAPEYSNARGFNVTWDALSTRERNEGFCYSLTEESYSVTYSSAPQSVSVYACVNNLSSYFRNFPDVGRFYRMRLCKVGTNARYGPVGTLACASTDTRLIDDTAHYAAQPANAVGSTPYSVDVDRKGSAVVDIPIKVLPGDNGMEPALSLTYNSSGSDQREYFGKPQALLRNGWNLSGFSQIHRCRRGDNDEVVEDLNNPVGFLDPLTRPRIRFDNTDALCIDDQKLVLVSGNHFKVGAVYRTYIESYKRIEIKAAPGHEGNPNTSEIWFDVRQPDGRISHYGKQSQARMKYYSASPYLAWAMERVEDPFGNAMTFAYTKASAKSGSPVLTNTIQNYSSRLEESAVRFWPNSVTYPGGKVAIQLTGSNPRIEAQSQQGATRRVYHLGYNGSGQERLTSVQECGNSGNSCLPPLTFAYEFNSYSNEDALITLTDGVGAVSHFTYTDIDNQCYSHQREHILEDKAGEVYPEVLATRTESDVVTLSSMGSELTKYFRGHSGDQDLFCRGRQAIASTVGRSVDTMSTSDGLGGLNTWTYRYGDPGFNSHYGRGFVGYSLVRVTDEQTGMTTYTQYRLKEIVAGMVQEEMVYDRPLDRYLSDVGSSSGSAELLSHTMARHNVLTITHSNGAKTYLPYTLKQDSRSYENGVFTGATFEENNYTLSGGYPSKLTTTVTTGHRVSDGNTQVSNAWGDYYPSSMAAGDVITTQRTETYYSNYTNSSDWRIQFVNKRRSTQYNGAIGSASDVKTQELRFTPWQSTMAVASETRFPNHADLELITHNSYDNVGNLTSTRVSGQHVAERSTHFADYSNGPVPVFITNALGHQTMNMGWNDRYRRPEVLLDPNGRVTTARHDGFERVVKTVDHDGNTVTVDYLDCTSVTCCIDESCSSLGAGLGAEASYVKITRSDTAPEVKEVHDVHNRVIRTYTQGLNSGEWIKTATVYNRRGLVEKQSLPYTQLSERRFTTFTYDQLGRKTRATRPDGSHTEWRYLTHTLNGEVLTQVVTIDRVLDASGNFLKTRAKVGYTNAAGQLVLSVEGYTSNSSFTTLGAMDSSARVTTTYEYDALNKPVRVSVDGGSDGTTVTTTDYDDAGNRVELIGPNVGRVDNRYTALNQVRYTRDALGHETTQEYDLLGRLEYKIAGQDYYRYEYDGWQGKGLLRSALHNDSYKVDYNYDEGRVTRVREFINLNGHGNSTSAANVANASTDYTYDSKGRVATMEYASGRAVRNVYSATGYLTEMRDDDSNALLHKVESVGAYGVESVRYGNNATTSHDYDIETGFLKELAHRNSAGSALHRQEYRWHSSGNMQERGYSRFSQSSRYYKETFTYDAHDRLTRTQVYRNGALQRTLNYGYNRLGNLTHKTSTRSADDQVSSMIYGTRRSGCSATPGPHAVSYASINGVGNSLCYDQKGQITRYIKSGDDKFVAYNQQGQPVTITVGSSLNDSTPEAKNEFAYGPNGQRYYQKAIHKDGSTTKTEHRFYFSDGTEYSVYEGTSSHPKVYKSYASGNVQFIKKFNNISWQDTTQYLHKDHLGSVVAITDETLSSGDAIHKLAFEPFGSRRKSDWSGKLSESEKTTLLNSTDDNTTRGFTGHEHLDKTGFVHMNGRVYDPTLGRFLTPDPLVQAPTLSQSWNRYSYVWNNPLRNTDPSGYATESPGPRMQIISVTGGWSRGRGTNASYQMRVARGDVTANLDNVDNNDDDEEEKKENGDIEVEQRPGAEQEGTQEGSEQTATSGDNSSAEPDARKEKLDHKLTIVATLDGEDDDIGHAYVVLTDADGNPVARGFYPANYPNTDHFEAMMGTPGTVKDDEDYYRAFVNGEGLNASKEFSISASQYSSALNEITRQTNSPPTYRIRPSLSSSCHCGTFVGDVAQAAGINFKGGTPVDLYKQFGGSF